MTCGQPRKLSALRIKQQQQTQFRRSRVCACDAERMAQLESFSLEFHIFERWVYDSKLSSLSLSLSSSVEISERKITQAPEAASDTWVFFQDSKSASFFLFSMMRLLLKHHHNVVVACHLLLLLQVVLMAFECPHCNERFSQLHFFSVCNI
jgi:hypothetical protein